MFPVNWKKLIPHSIFIDHYNYMVIDSLSQQTHIYINIYSFPVQQHPIIDLTFIKIYIVLFRWFKKRKTNSTDFGSYVCIWMRTCVQIGKCFYAILQIIKSNEFYICVFVVCVDIDIMKSLHIKIRYSVHVRFDFIRHINSTVNFYVTAIGEQLVLCCSSGLIKSA